MQDYIDKNLDFEITLSDLAEVSLYSPWYSYRLFRAYLGQTPAEYIRKMRLSCSAIRLKTGGFRVVGVANPRIQTGPRGERGYIELRAVKRKVSK